MPRDEYSFFYAAISKAYKQAKYYPTQEHRYFLVLHFNTDTSQSILRLLDFCVKTYQSVEPDFLTHLTWSSFLYPLTFMTLLKCFKMVNVMLRIILILNWKHLVVLPWNLMGVNCKQKVFQKSNKTFLKGKYRK